MPPKRFRRVLLVEISRVEVFAVDWEAATGRAREAKDDEKPEAGINSANASGATRKNFIVLH